MATEQQIDWLRTRIEDYQSQIDKIQKDSVGMDVYYVDPALIPLYCRLSEANDILQYLKSE